MSRQSIRVEIPAGKTIAGVRFLVSKEAAEYRIANGAIELAVPGIGLHEVITFYFAS